VLTAAGSLSFADFTRSFNSAINPIIQPTSIFKSFSFSPVIFIKVLLSYSLKSIFLLLSKEFKQALRPHMHLPAASDF